MRILNIMQCTNLGGMEQSALRLMLGLGQRGHQCRVISLTPLGPLLPHLQAADIEAIGFEYRGAFGWRSFPTLRRHLAGESADAIIMTGSNLLASMALGRLARGNRLLAMHFHHSVRPAWQWQIFYGLARSRFNAITYPSDFLRSEAETIVPGLRRLTRTVRNPLVPPAPFGADDRIAARKALGLPLSGPLVGNAGWLIPRKRYDIFLKTAALIAAVRPDIRFVIAGNGEQEQELRALAETLGLADRVIWLDWLGDMHNFYLSLDLLLFNSDWDAWGNTPVEAMTYGVPVVASVLNGGLGEIISEDRFGTLLDTHDTEKLAAAALSLLGGAGSGVAEAGRSRAIAMSDPSRIVDEVEALLTRPAAALQPASSASLEDVPSHKRARAG
ncbi:MAG TPA: glycosyltransferase [Devosiaceae bacterium]|jgi:glycosyltransferase involved in cell wall biosynthesis